MSSRKRTTQIYPLNASGGFAPDEKLSFLLGSSDSLPTRMKAARIADACLGGSQKRKPIGHCPHGVLGTCQAHYSGVHTIEAPPLVGNSSVSSLLQGGAQFPVAALVMGDYAMAGEKNDEPVSTLPGYTGGFAENSSSYSGAWVDLGLGITMENFRSPVPVPEDFGPGSSVCLPPPTEMQPLAQKAATFPVSSAATTPPMSMPMIHRAQSDFIPRSRNHAFWSSPTSFNLPPGQAVYSSPAVTNISEFSSAASPFSAIQATNFLEDPEEVMFPLSQAYGNRQILVENPAFPSNATGMATPYQDMIALDPPLRRSPSRSPSFDGIAVQCKICRWQPLPYGHTNPKYRLSRHMKRKHGGERFTCPVCPETFSRIDNMKEHENKIHKGKYRTEGNVNRVTKPGRRGRKME